MELIEKLKDLGTVHAIAELFDFVPDLEELDVVMNDTDFPHNVSREEVSELMIKFEGWGISSIEDEVMHTIKHEV